MRALVVCVLLSSSLFAQTPQTSKAAETQVSPALQLLREVRDKYANAKSYWIEAVAEETSTQELHRSWQKSFFSAAEAPGNKRKFTGRDATGEAEIVSDGAKEWHWRKLEAAYTEAPLEKSDKGGLLGMGDYSVARAKFLRKDLLQVASRLKDARFLPDENVKLNGRTVHCKVVTFNSADSKNPSENLRTNLTYKIWIDQDRKLLVKTMHSGENFIRMGNGASLPFHQEDVTLFTRADIDPQFPPDFFTFTPPAEAKLVSSFDDGMPDFRKLAKAMIGKPAPETELQGEEGKNVTLASLKGKPVLLNFWATWCAPCVEEIPDMIKLNSEVRSTALQWFSVDVQDDAKTVNDFLKHKNIPWTNFHDHAGVVANTFHTPGVPAVVLIDAEGKVAYIGSELKDVRAAIARLGPEYAHVANAPSAATTAQ